MKIDADKFPWLTTKSTLRLQRDNVIQKYKQPEEKEGRRTTDENLVPFDGKPEL